MTFFVPECDLSSSSGPTLRNENYGLSPVPLQGHHDVDKLDINCLRCTRISSILHGQQCPIVIIVWIPSSIAKSCTTHSSINERGSFFKGHQRNSSHPKISFEPLISRKLEIDFLWCTRVSSILHGQEWPIAIIVWIESSIVKSCTTHSSICDIGVYFGKTLFVLEYNYQEFYIGFNDKT